MKARDRQRGLGLLGLFFVLSYIGVVALLLIKCGPLYMNEMTIQRDLKAVAAQLSSTGGDLDINEVRRAVQSRWDIDYISQLTAQDIQVNHNDQGWSLSYDYEARAKLFMNVFIVIHFAQDYPLHPRSAS